MMATGLLLGAAGCEKEDDEVVDPFADVDLEVDKSGDWLTYEFSELELPYEDEASCIEFNTSELGYEVADVECQCNECLDLMQECDALEGCIEIRDCAFQSGCNNEFTCYLAPGAACVEVIDRWGNAGVATALSQLLRNCQNEHCMPADE